jgi:carboxypeptidase C (cathepsin A)
MAIKKSSAWLIALLVFSALYAFSQAQSEKKEVQPIPEPEISVTQQTVKINNVTIPLTTRAGTLLLRDENNEPIALFGFTSYTREGQNNPKRPVVFAYNGGSGSSSF